MPRDRQFEQLNVSAVAAVLDAGTEEPVPNADDAALWVISMLIWSEGGAPPAGPGKATSVFAPIRFQFVTSFACAVVGAASVTTAASANQTIR